MDQALFGARSTVRGVLLLTGGKGGGEVNCIKLSCHRGRVIVNSFLRDKSLNMVVIRNKGTNGRSKHFFAKSSLHPAETAKCRSFWKFSCKGSGWLLVYGRLWSRKAKCFDLGIWTCLSTGEPELFMTMTGGSRSISRGCGTIIHNYLN